MPSNQFQFSPLPNALAPAIAPFGDVDTGIYAVAANELGIACNGAQVVDISTTGVTITGTITASGGTRSSVPAVETTSLTALTTAGNETYTAAMIGGGVITRNCNGSNRTDTTDTAANIIAGSPALSTNGDTQVCYLVNVGSNTITLAAGDSVTIANVGQTVATNEAALLIFRRTSATAVTLYIIGA